jgi:hypothetical protein
MRVPGPAGFSRKTGGRLARVLRGPLKANKISKLAACGAYHGGFQINMVQESRLLLGGAGLKEFQWQIPHLEV